MCLFVFYVEIDFAVAKKPYLRIKMTIVVMIAAKKTKPPKTPKAIMPPGKSIKFEKFDKMGFWSTFEMANNKKSYFFGENKVGFKNVNKFWLCAFSQFFSTKSKRELKNVNKLWHWTFSWNFLRNFFNKIMTRMVSRS